MQSLSKSPARSAPSASAARRRLVNWVVGLELLAQEVVARLAATEQPVEVQRHVGAPPDGLPGAVPDPRPTRILTGTARGGPCAC